MVLISYKTNTVVLTFLSNFYPKKITYCLIYKQSNFQSLSLQVSRMVSQHIKWTLRLGVSIWVSVSSSCRVEVRVFDKMAQP